MTPILLPSKKLEDYFESRDNPVKAAFDFGTLRQNVGERIRDFEIRVRLAAKRCNFGNPEERIKEQLIAGTTDRKLRKLVIRDKFNTVQDMVVAGELNETCDIYDKTAEKVNFIKGKPNFGAPPVKVQQTDGVTCYACNKKGHYAATCPNRACNYCKEPGHIKANCEKLKSRNAKNTRPAAGRTNYGRDSSAGGPRKRHADDNLNGNENSKRLKTEVKMVQEEVTNTEMMYFIGGTDTTGAVLGGVKIELVIDSGCVSNLIDRKTWEYLKANRVKVSESRNDSDRVFNTFGAKEPLVVLGRFKAMLEVGSSTDEEQFYVIDVEDKCILGAKTAKERGILKIQAEKVMNVDEYAF